MQPRSVGGALGGLYGFQNGVPILPLQKMQARSNGAALSVHQTMPLAHSVRRGYKDCRNLYLRELNEIG